MIGAASRLVSAADYHAAARRKLPRFLADYYDGFAFDGVTGKRNRTDLLSTIMPQRVIRDVAGATLDSRILDEDVAAPFALSPVGLAGMASPRGEAAAARAARAEGIPFTLSTTSICPLDEVAKVAPPWLQLYMIRDRSFVAMLLEWALQSGCRTVVLTVDLPILGPRWTDQHSGLSAPGISGQLRRGLQIASRPVWALNTALRGCPHVFGNIVRFLDAQSDLADCIRFIGANTEMALGPETVRWVRDRWPHRLLIKGIMCGEDAKHAIGLGADGVIVSNHGGRQLDGVRSTISALPEIRAAVGDDVPLIMDGGIRSGLDVARALLAGADLAMFGRPWVWALAAGGEAGVRQYLATIKSELAVAYALCGTRSTAEMQQLGRDLRHTPVSPAS